jgi:transcriptional regulator with XRE-family HTH domain
MAKSNTWPTTGTTRKLPNDEELRRLKDRDFRESSLLPSQVFGQRMQEFRRARGLDQADLAQLMTAKGFPISQPTLSQIEKGRRKRGVTLDEAFAITEALRAVPAHLLTPPGDKLIRLSESVATDGAGIRQWLVSGLPWTTGHQAVQPPPAEVAEDVARERFQLRLGRLAFAFADAARVDGEGRREAVNAAADAIVEEVKRGLRERGIGQSEDPSASAIR